MTQAAAGDRALVDDHGVVHLSDPPDREGERRADPAPVGSLLNDVEDLLLDAKTYVDAELTYQKTRLSYITACIKKMVAFGAAAAVLGLVALIALAVGLIIAFTPLITAWGATALVVGALLLAAYLLVRQLSTQAAEMRAAMQEEKGPSDGK